MLGDTVPLISSLPAALDAVPTAKCVMVAVDPVQAGKLIVATGETLLFVTVQPPDVRATATRAYDV